MKKWIFILLASTSFSALPPLAQSIREMQALLSDHRFYTALGSAELLQDIIRKENGYLILTKNYAMLVDVHYIQSETKLIGPAKFEFEFHEPINLSAKELMQ